MSLSVLVQQARKILLLDTELKGKIVLRNCNSIIHQSFEDIVTFNMNLKFTETTQNSCTFAMDIFETDLCKKIWDD